MKLVILESPFGSSTPEGIAMNVAYARRCVRDCLQRGESPAVSHLLFTQPGILRDEVPAERELGIRAGLAWGGAAEATVVYMDRGVSRGMQFGIEKATEEGRPVIYRTLENGDYDGGNWPWPKMEQGGECSMEGPGGQRVIRVCAKGPDA